MVMVMVVPYFSVAYPYQVCESPLMTALECQSHDMPVVGGPGNLRKRQYWRMRSAMKYKQTRAADM